MPPFKHEFYAVAIKLDGGGFAKTGNYSTENLNVTIFFNSPYQILQWDIPPDWKGFYIIFSEDFYRNTLSQKRITEQYPFLLADRTAPISLTEKEAEPITKMFMDMFEEHAMDLPTGKTIIRHYIHIMLHKVARNYTSAAVDGTSYNERSQDLHLVSRFKSLLEIGFHPDQAYDELRPHQVQYYADKLSLHPNHFNAVIKRITDISASEHIYRHILSLAKSKLLNTDKSVKEIAFELYYNYPNHFAIFFKKQMGMTPSQYRKSV